MRPRSTGWAAHKRTRRPAHPPLLASSYYLSPSRRCGRTPSRVFLAGVYPDLLLFQKPASSFGVAEEERAKAGRSSLPESLRWDAERPVEARGCVLPRDDHRQLRDGVVVVVLSHPRE